MNVRRECLAVDPVRAALYVPPVIKQIPRLLSCLDREPHSVSFGCFDRTHWAWKFHDFPLTMLQINFYPLALLWRVPFPNNPYHQNAQVLSWIAGAIEYTCARQRPNGAFDSVGPFTQDHGVTLAMVFGLVETLRLIDSGIGSHLRERVVRAVRQGCEFALHSREDYAVITNHQALFAAAFLGAADLLNEDRWRSRADDVMGRILAAQSPEGWYREYDGPDPGYESLGIFYLALCWRRTGSERLLESLRRSIAFYAYSVHPDGSVGGVYGSRHTALYFPAGFEMLAPSVPLADSVARFMRQRLTQGNVLTPDASDMENLASLLYAYLEGCLGPPTPAGNVPPLPCESLNGVHRFQHCGIVVSGSPSYYAVVNTAKGGVCRIFSKEPAAVTYEDAGYCARSKDKLLTSQIIGLGGEVDSGQTDVVCCQTDFAEACQEMLTPVKFILLRILNLTAFRSIHLGGWIRRRILARLILKKRIVPLRLRRRLLFFPDAVQIHDCVESTGGLPLQSLDLTRSFTGIHMGSAKYFHPAEIRSKVTFDSSGLLDGLKKDGQGTVMCTIRFPAGSMPELVVSEGEMAMPFRARSVS